MKKWLFCIVVLAGCSKIQRDDCITSLGKVTTEVRNVEPFSDLYVEDRIQVVIVQDITKEGTIELEGPSNLLPQFFTVLENGVLRLENNNTCNFVRSFDYELKATVYISQLSNLTVESIATVTTRDTLNIADLYITHNALSDIDLSLNCSGEVLIRSLNSAHTVLRGKAKALRGSIEEISDLDARAFTCEEVLLDSHTPIDCYVNGTKGLFIKIFNSGNVYYSAEPSDYKELNVRRGTGDLILLK